MANAVKCSPRKQGGKKVFFLHIYLCMIKMKFNIESIYFVACNNIRHVYRAFHSVLRDYKHLWQENQRTYLNGIVHSHKKSENFVFFSFLQLEMFDVCTTGDIAHIDTIFKLLPHTYWCVPCHPWCTHRISLVVTKKTSFSFSVAVKNSMKVGPLVFLL
jgi:hypothetical protein